jgi:hypothetical protein
MRRMQLLVGIAVLGLLVLAVALQADVKTQEKSQVKFEGMLGRMVGLFGGKAAKEGVVSTIAVKGDRRMRVDQDRGEIVDLAEEKVYDLNIKDKTYTVATFAEIRKRLEEQAQKAAEDAKKTQGKEKAAQKEPGQPEMETEVSVKETGQKKSINNFSCREVIMTITSHEKGKTLEQAGGTIVSADTWLAPKNPAIQEIAEFELRYWQKIQTPAMMASAEQMASAMAMYPGLKQAFSKLQSEKVNMDGTPILTTVTFGTVPSAEQQAAQEQKQEQKPEQAPPPTSVGGLVGRFARKKAEEPKKEEPTGGAKGQTTIVTMINEVLSVTPAASDADVAVPAGFKQR